MAPVKTYWPTLLVLLLLLLFCFLGDISLGSVNIPFGDTLSSLMGRPLANTSSEYILWNYRLPKAITAILVGGGLGLSGLLMQTLFRNPLAGPYVLGISSGASLGAALCIMGSSLFNGMLSWGFAKDLTLVLASSLGSFLVLALVLVIAIKIKDTMALLIIGLMLGSITGAIVSVLSYFTKAENLQRYVFWTYGSLGGLDWNKLIILTVCCAIGLLLALGSGKWLNAYLLGENYAQSMGVNLRRSRTIILISTGLLAGSITAFAGPIAFVGLAVPHMARQLFSTSNHNVLIPIIVLLGGIVMLICDGIAQLPGQETVLPINAITSIFGAPVVIWLLLKKRRITF